METLKKVVAQTSWQVIGKAATSISSLILLGIITRSYGEAGTGVYTLALAYLNFFYFASDIGLNAHLLPSLDQITFKKLLGMRLSWAVILTAIAVLLLPIINISTPGFNIAVLIGLPSILFSALFITNTIIFQKHLNFSFSALSLGLGAVLAVIMVWYFSTLNLPPQYLVIAHTSDWILAGVLATIFIKRYIKDITPVVELSFIKKTSKEVWLLSLTLTISLVYFRIDTFFLSKFRPIEEVGVYNLAYQLFQSALLASTFIINSYYPLMIKARERGLNYFYSQVLKACGLMGLLALSGSVFTYFTAPLFISVVSGGVGFTGAVESLRILSYGFPAFFISSILMWVLITNRSYKALVSIYIVGLIINTTLNYLFIPQYSYIAASWVTVVSEYLILLMQVIVILVSPPKRGASRIKA